jgi:hypothetical protein
MTNSPQQAGLPAEDINMVELWLRRDPIRWLAGVLAGIFAGICMMVFMMIVNKVLGGQDVFFPVKLAAVPFMGNRATAFDSGAPAILFGFAVLEALCAFLGFVYAQFTQTNHLGALLGMGFTWGAFSWIFLSNLYFQSISELHAYDYSHGVALVTCMVFGFSLTSVAFFDRMLRGAKRG